MNVRELERALERLGEPRVLIVGDLMLDRYVTGDVTRISPEAPIPVIAARHSEEKLGGAGNVLANLCSMRAKVELVGMVGDDGWGAQIRELFANLGVPIDGLVTDPTRPTILKTRMMSGVQQMLRVDWEDVRPATGAVEDALRERALAAVERADAVVLSDYGKGVLTDTVMRPLIDAARARKIPVLVDPKGSDYRRYRGASLVTPNRREAEQALGRTLVGPDAVDEGARELMELAELDAAVITLGAEGILYRTRDGESGREPARARAVFDVTGAGDTVVSHLALYLAGGLGLARAVALANMAAGIVVGRLGASTVTRAELFALMRDGDSPRGKVLAPENLDATVTAWRQAGRRIVFTNGCFDILHAGHVDYLRFARSQGDVLLVGVNDDASVKRLKGDGRPINHIEDRLTVLAALEMVDGVVPFGEDTPAELVKRVTPHVLVKGEDWRDKGVVGREWVEGHGGTVVLAPMTPGRSTTNILERARPPEA